MATKYSCDGRECDFDTRNQRELFLLTYELDNPERTVMEVDLCAKCLKKITDNGFSEIRCMMGVEIDLEEKK